MAAEDLKSKKRKGAADAAPKPKKQKKVEEATKLPKAGKTATEPTESTPVKKSRKRAADFFEDDNAAKEESAKVKKPKKRGAASLEVNGTEQEAAGSESTASADLGKSKKSKKSAKGGIQPQPEPKGVAEAPKEKGQKSKKGKASDAVERATVKVSKNSLDGSEVASTVTAKSLKKPQKTQKATKEPTPEAESDVDAEEGDEEDDEDHTDALLAGFESEEDENDPEVDENFSETAKVMIDKKTEKQLAKAEKNTSKPGVVYVGRIPHGFFEPQMKGYFSQFGTLTNLRLSRNKKTGASKHYAFVEFASEEVADIVARTMDKYLLFGHILQCRVIPTEQVHEDLFAGANRRFKIMPRNKMAGLQMARGAEREQWEKRVKNEGKRRSAKQQKLKEDFGYEFTAPTLKSVKDVSKQTPTLENGQSQQLLIEAPTESIADESIESKPAKVQKTKRGAKSNGAQPVDDVTGPTPIGSKNAKKDKKSKAEGVPAVADEVKSKSVSKTKNTKPDTKDVDVDSAVNEIAGEKKRKGKEVAQEGSNTGKKAKRVKA